MSVKMARPSGKSTGVGMLPHASPGCTLGLHRLAEATAPVLGGSVTMVWKRTATALALGPALLVGPAPVQAADFPDGFELASSWVEMRTFTVAMGGSSTRIVRSEGTGTIETCQGPGALSSCEDPAVTRSAKAKSTAADHLDLLNVVLDSRLLSLTPGRVPDRTALLVPVDGGRVGVVSFTKSHSTSVTITVTAGSRSHSVSWDLSSPPCGVSTVAALLEAMAREATETPGEAKE
jgi:hypothetical protein